MKVKQDNLKYIVSQIVEEIMKWDNINYTHSNKKFEEGVKTGFKNAKQKILNIIIKYD